MRYALPRNHCTWKEIWEEELLRRLFTLAEPTRTSQNARVRKVHSWEFGTSRLGSRASFVLSVFCARIKGQTNGECDCCVNVSPTLLFVNSVVFALCAVVGVLFLLLVVYCCCWWCIVVVGVLLLLVVCCYFRW